MFGRVPFPVIVPMLAALLAALALPAPARALTQVEISSVSDFALGTWNMGDPDVNASIDVCAYAVLNSPAGGYAITASSSGGFVLKNGSQQIPYSLSWDDGGAGGLGGSATPLVNNSKLTGQLNGNTSLPLCLLGSPTARLKLKIAQSDMTAALAGTYSGTLSLTLSPN